MISGPDPVTLKDDAPPSVRSEMALYGLYEISKVLCGPGNLQEILITTLSVLESFLDMDNSLIMLPDEAGGAETVVSGLSGSTDARRYFEALPEQAIGQLITTAVPLVVTDVGRDRVFTGDT
jgi:Nif-specific regulatory protein